MFVLILQGSIATATVLSSAILGGGLYECLVVDSLLAQTR